VTLWNWYFSNSWKFI